MPVRARVDCMLDIIINFADTGLLIIRNAGTARFADARTRRMEAGYGTSRSRTRRTERLLADQNVTRTPNCIVRNCPFSGSPKSEAPSSATNVKL